MDAREAVARYLSGKSGFILVSHDRAFLDRCVDHVLIINKRDIEIIHGNFSAWWEQKKRQDAYELAKNERLGDEIARLKVSVAHTSRWSDKVEKSKNQPLKSGLSADKGYIGHKSAKMMKRAKSIERRQRESIEEKSKLLRNIEEAEDLKIHPLRYHSSRLMTLENVAVSYDGREIFRDVSLALSQGQRLALLGGNGSGKSSLLKLICGEDIPHGGTVSVASGLTISYVPQDASFLAGGLEEYAASQQADITLFKTILRKLDFSRVQFEKDMRDYSAGQKKKVLLARSLCERAHVYIWDEPLNYIDVLSRMQIEELILAYKPTLLFVEHDRAFCDNIATGTVTLGG
jgi:lincosamide and streptogramin A transport system ATP-binding/permease protein